MYLVKDGRGYFYLCESKREGGRIVRRKLAYLGRMKMPYEGEKIPLDSHKVFAGTSGNYLRGDNTRNGSALHVHLREKYLQTMEAVRRVRSGEEKPKIELAIAYCRAVTWINPRYWAERDLINRALKALHICACTANVVPKPIS